MRDKAHKIHIILPIDCRKDDELRTELVQKLVEEYGLEELNEKRVERLGIASGYMSDEDAQRLCESKLVDPDKIHWTLDQVRSIKA